jgi:hypothetical protein
MIVFVSAIRPVRIIPRARRKGSARISMSSPSSSRPPPSWVGRGAVGGLLEADAFGDRARAHVDVEDVPDLADGVAGLLDDLAAYGDLRVLVVVAEPARGLDQRPSGCPLTYTGKRNWRVSSTVPRSASP